MEKAIEAGVGNKVEGTVGLLLMHVLHPGEVVRDGAVCK